MAASYIDPAAKWAYDLREKERVEEARRQAEATSPEGYFNRARILGQELARYVKYWLYEFDRTTSIDLLNRVGESILDIAYDRYNTTLSSTGNYESAFKAVELLYSQLKSQVDYIPFNPDRYGESLRIINVILKLGAESKARRSGSTGPAASTSGSSSSRPAASASGTTHDWTMPDASWTSPSTPESGPGGSFYDYRPRDYYGPGRPPYPRPATSAPGTSSSTPATSASASSAPRPAAPAPASSAPAPATSASGSSARGPATSASSAPAPASAPAPRTEGSSPLEKEISRIKSASDFYDIIGVPDGASKSEIRKAFLKISRIIHPDKVQEESLKAEANSAFQKLNNAYESLKESGTRRVRRRYNKSKRSKINTTKKNKGKGRKNKRQ